MKVSPSVRGMRWFTWTMTRFAARMAARVASTSTPKLMKPWASGGDAETIATSSGPAPERNRRGISWKKTGT
jgi:hypothetical protein